ncbi:hypothetical protein AS034_05130 [[Bacillus] enclensis]|uniref:Uncharacterized protein n=1 Tax=[Bacillus] enclensis TaxID=1402860 RepID=A0A0V8HNG5_9BACI|nr:hypothetical protein [[Bacillus] enclensis]KSU63632.1 hypothetical protein AS034_05130 [[Bacillus] enclensis]SCB87232.1 hypothetical protein GA0061094_1070 [[Bacillus] enclensis]
MDLVSALAAKGELITLKDKLITLGLEIDDGKASKEELLKRVAMCIENVEELETMVRFNYDKY